MGVIALLHPLPRTGSDICVPFGAFVAHAAEGHCSERCGSTGAIDAPVAVHQQRGFGAIDRVNEFAKRGPGHLFIGLEVDFDVLDVLFGQEFYLLCASLTAVVTAEVYDRADVVAINPAAQLVNSRLGGTVDGPRYDQAEIAATDVKHEVVPN